MVNCSLFTCCLAEVYFSKKITINVPTYCVNIKYNILTNHHSLSRVGYNAARHTAARPMPQTRYIAALALIVPKLHPLGRAMHAIEKVFFDNCEKMHSLKEYLFNLFNIVINALINKVCFLTFHLGNNWFPPRFS